MWVIIIDYYLLQRVWLDGGAVVVEVLVAVAGEAAYKRNNKYVLFSCCFQKVFTTL